MDGRPVAEYIALNFRDSPFNASSVIFRIGRNGCSAGTRCSGDK
jgi:hypothetical protein